MGLDSPSCYYSPFYIVALLFALLFFSLPCCFPHRVVVLLFVLLLSSSHRLAFLFTLLLSFLAVLLFQVQGSLRCYFPICATLLSSLCYYSLKNLVLSPYIPSCKNWEWSQVENWKPIFFNQYFSHCLFPFF
jgi:hypothetical protein